MTPEQSRAIAALQGVTFLPGCAPKRFARVMGYAPEDYELTPRQDKYLWWVTYRFRRQIRDAEIVEYARTHMVPLEQLPAPAPRRRRATTKATATAETPAIVPSEKSVPQATQLSLIGEPYA